LYFSVSVSLVKIFDLAYGNKTLVELSQLARYSFSQKCGRTRVRCAQVM